MVTSGVAAFVALVVGYVLGRVHQVAIRAWADYRATKAQVPVLLKAAIVATRGMGGAVVMAAIVAGVALYTASK